MTQNNPAKTSKKKSAAPAAETLRVTKDTNLADLLFKHPATAEVLTDFGLHCVGCFASSFDTIEAGALVHGFSQKDIEELVARLNEVVEFGE
jgi:hybrid cluster-associated redox disulfide protein